jgi:hypothetical protein
MPVFLEDQEEAARLAWLAAPVTLRQLLLHKVIMGAAAVQEASLGEAAAPVL